MKKEVLIILCSGIMLSGLFSQTSKQTDLGKDLLKGKIKSVSTNHFKALDKFGTIKKSEKYKFDSIEGNIYAEYNLEGFKTKETNCDIYSAIITKTYNYDTLRNIIEICKYTSDGKLDYKEIFKYDTNGNRIESNSYKLNGNLYSRSIWKINDKGKDIGFFKYNSDGNLEFKSIYQYDNFDRKIEATSYSNNGTLFAKSIFKYDGNNYLKEKNVTGAFGVWSKYMYSYNNQGNKIYETYVDDSNKHKTTKFDENGNHLEFNDNGVIYYYEYKYDNYNWVEKITYVGEARIPVTVTERIIEYFK